MIECASETPLCTGCHDQGLTGRYYRDEKLRGLEEEAAFYYHGAQNECSQRWRTEAREKLEAVSQSIRKHYVELLQHYSEIVERETMIVNAYESDAAERLRLQSEIARLQHEAQAVPSLSQGNNKEIKRLKARLHRLVPENEYAAAVHRATLDQAEKALFWIEKDKKAFFFGDWDFIKDVQ